MSINEKSAEEQEEKEVSATAKKLQLIKKVRSISNPDSKWTITQEILQEIMATYTIKSPKNMPRIPTLVEDLKKEITLRYVDQPEMIELLTESIPADRHVGNWIKKEGWEEAMWTKIRVGGLFTAEKRAEVIESLRRRAIDKSDVAAKIYLTMSGDYTEKTEIDNKTIDTYREVNKILHNKDKE